MAICPCGSHVSYEKCCGSFITGEELPKSPEQLMRARYTAFTQANVDYIVKTMRKDAVDDFNPENTRQWAQQVEWVGLEVLNAPPVTNKKQTATVEFIASYRQQGKLQNIREVSEFKYSKDRWYYTGGQGEVVNKTVHTATKVGRNDPCPCNSGKKFKKCCGN